MKFANSVLNSTLISFTNVFLYEISPLAFFGIEVQLIEVSDYHLCCAFSNRKKCTATVPWYISCSDLLPTLPLKYFILPSDWVELSQLTQDLSDEDDKKLFERIEKWLKQKSHRSHIWQAYQEQLPLGGGRTSSKGSCKKLLDNAILKNSPSSDNK